MDPYVYPETTILRNLRDIRDSEQLNRFEALMTSRRTIELEHEPTRGRFDAQHLRSVHHHIFQDVYDWAGYFRTVNISKSGDPFAFHQHIAPNVDRICAELKGERLLVGADAEWFANRGAYYLGEINAIHPFRDGNGRTQREFIRQLGVRNRLVLDWSRVSREEMIEVSRQSLRVDNTGLQKALRKALDNEWNRQGAKS